MFSCTLRYFTAGAGSVGGSFYISSSWRQEQPVSYADMRCVLLRLVWHASVPEVSASVHDLLETHSLVLVCGPLHIANAFKVMAPDTRNAHCYSKEVKRLRLII